VIGLFGNEEKEIAAVADWLRIQVLAGMPARDIALFVRSEAQISRAQAAAKGAGLAYGAEWQAGRDYLDVRRNIPNGEHLHDALG
jgi:hypothetical protein